MDLNYEKKEEKQQNYSKYEIDEEEFDKEVKKRQMMPAMYSISQDIKNESQMKKPIDQSSRSIGPSLCKFQGALNVSDLCNNLSSQKKNQSQQHPSQPQQQKEKDVVYKKEDNNQDYPQKELNPDLQELRKAKQKYDKTLQFQDFYKEDIQTKANIQKEKNSEKTACCLIF